MYYLTRAKIIVGTTDPAGFREIFHLFWLFSACRCLAHSPSASDPENSETFFCRQKFILTLKTEINVAPKFHTRLKVDIIIAASESQNPLTHSWPHSSWHHPCPLLQHHPFSSPLFLQMNGSVDDRSAACLHPWLYLS